MTCVRTPPRLRRSLQLSGPGETFYPASEWMPATGLSAVDLLMNVQSAQGRGQVKPGLQLARARTDKPEPGRAISSGHFVDIEGLHHFRERPELGEAAFVRFGFVGRMPRSSRGQSLVEVEMDVAVKLCGEVLGTKTVEIQPFAVGGEEGVVPITDWSPTVGVERLKTVFVLLDNQGDSLQYRLVVRTAQDRMAPGPWVAAEDWQRPGVGNSERNTGELTLPDGACFGHHALFQLGLAFRRVGGSERGPRCIVHTLSHCRYA